MKLIAGLAWGGVIFGVVLTGGCTRQPAAAAPGMPPPLVTVTTASSRDVPVYLDEIGTGAASDSVTITPQVSGPIVERHFEDGADLKKGQLLFEIDPRPFKAQLDLAQAQLATNHAALELATIQLKRYDEVADTRAIAKTDYDIKKNAVDVAKAQIQASEATIETARLNLEYCAIHSPITGRAGRRLVDVGNVVVGNQTGLLSIQLLDPLYVYFTIDERDLPRVQAEVKKGTLKTLVRLPSETLMESRTGKLQFLDNSVQEGTGTVSLRATVGNADRHFWPGQFVNVRLVLSTLKDAVLVPNECAQISQQGPFVYVVKTDETAELRQVTLGQRQGDEVVITDGVKTGERVVLTGQMLVRPEGKVRIEAPATSTAPGTGPASGPSTATSTGPSTGAATAPSTGASATGPHTMAGDH